MIKTFESQRRATADAQGPKHDERCVTGRGTPDPLQHRRRDFHGQPFDCDAACGAADALIHQVKAAGKNTILCRNRGETHG